MRGKTRGSANSFEKVKGTGATKSAEAAAAAETQVAALPAALEGQLTQGTSNLLLQPVCAPVKGKAGGGEKRGKEEGQGGELVRSKDGRKGGRYCRGEPAAMESQTTNSQTGSEQITANSQQPTANSQQPTANSQQPTANSQQPIAYSLQPTANSQGRSRDSVRQEEA